MLLFFTASEPGGIPGKSPQMKVIQQVATALTAFVQVQMHWAFCSAFRGDPFRKCLQGRFAFRRVSFPLSIWNFGYCCWNSCNTLAINMLIAWICIFAEFRCSCFPLHLNAEDSLANLCKWKLFSELQHVFYSHWASELWVLLLKFLQYACYEYIECLNLHFGRVQILLFFTASERGGIRSKPPQIKVIQ